MFGTEKRQLPSSGRTAKEKKKRGSVKSATAASKAESKKGGGECAGESGLQTATATADSKKEGGESRSRCGVSLAVRWDQGRPGCPKPTKCMKFTGCDYLMGFKPDPNCTYDKISDYDLIPEGALPEHRPHFYDMWRRYHTQLQSTNGMDLDTYPGYSMLADCVPEVLSPNTDDYAVAMDLIDLALEIYNNDPSNFFKYKFMKIEKVNLKLTGFLLYFMTVKFLNVTLGPVIETFQIYAGQSICRPHLEVFSCVPKLGPLI